MPQLMVSFRGTIAPDWVLAGLAAGEVAAVCLFAYNVESPRQLRTLATSLHEAARTGGRPPPLVGIDQEGGQLMAVTDGATGLPGNMALGASGRLDLAERAGRVLGLELLAMGCNLDFAPVVDLAHHPDNPVVGLRSFGDDPASVARLAAATVRGLQSTGLVATAKHFPGHGATRGDSHHEAPRIDRDRHRLEEAELVPFRAAIEAEVGAVMTAHVTYPALDDVPATLSRPILHDLLRVELGFGGLVVTDAMDMGAVAHLSPERRCAAALAAGADLVLLGHMEDQARLVHALAPAFDPTSLARIDAARRALPWDLPPLELVGSRDHRDLAQEIADAAVTVVRKRGIPLRPARDESLAVVTVVAGNLTPADTSSATTVRLAEQVARRHGKVISLTLPYRASGLAAAEVLAAASAADHLVVGTIDVANDPRQRALLRALDERGRPFVHVALRTPHDLTVVPVAPTALCGYGVREVNTEAVARVLFGEIVAGGRLPYAIPLPTATGDRPPTGGCGS